MFGNYSTNTARRTNPLPVKTGHGRQVYPTNEIAHLWAHQTQAAARNSQATLFFRGNTIFSYRLSWPLEHGKRLWPIIRRVMASGTPYQRNGHTEHVGNFAVSQIDVDGTLYAGCHTIPFAELARIAGQLGLEGGVV